MGRLHSSTIGRIGRRQFYQIVLSKMIAKLGGIKIHVFDHYQIHYLYQRREDASSVRQYQTG